MSFWQLFSSNVDVEKLPKQCSYEKFVYEMLMKLTPVRQFRTNPTRKRLVEWTKSKNLRYLQNTLSKSLLIYYTQNAATFHHNKCLSFTHIALLLLVWQWDLKSKKVNKTIWVKKAKCLFSFEELLWTVKPTLDGQCKVNCTQQIMWDIWALVFGPVWPVCSLFLLAIAMNDKQDFEPNKNYLICQKLLP